MKILSENLKDKFMVLKPYLPYGVLESWDDLNPKLYHSIHIYWLKFYGMWYNNHSPKSIYFWGHIVYTTIVLWLVCFLPCIGEVVYLLRRNENIGDLAEGLYLFLSEMYTYVKLAVFWFNKDKILNLLEYLHSDTFKPVEKEHRNIIKKSIKTARFVMTYYSIICVGAVSVGIVIPLTENFEVLATNVEYPFFDVYKSPAYNIVYIHHIYYKPATCIIDAVMDTILAAFVASAILGDLRYTYIEFLYYSVTTTLHSFLCARVGQINILGYNLRNCDVLAKKNLQQNQFNKLYTKENSMRYVLKKCVVHYNAIIRYVSMIEDAFSLASVLQFMLSVMVLCLIGIQFLSIENPTSHPMQITWMGIYLTCMLIEVFILCWFGNELILTSLQLRNAAFEGPWLEMDSKTTVLLIIFMERCKRPLKVTAGKIFILSLDTYTILINWSYKAFAVMRNMKK